MPFLIDSTVMVDHLGEEPSAVRLLNLLAPEGIAISIITYMEVYQGGILDHSRFTRLSDFVTAVEVINLSLQIVRRAALIRLIFLQQRLEFRRRTLDILIAATALEYGLTLVTQNMADFRRIPGLQVRSA